MSKYLSPHNSRRRQRLSLRGEALEQRRLLVAAPVITEFMASNDETLLDGDGNASDWIEIHNAGDSLANLADWYLTDDPTNLSKWPFPAIDLAVDQYMLVFASAPENANGELLDDYVDANGFLHANFRLAAGGEYLALVDASGDAPVVVSAYGSAAENYPAQRRDISFGIGNIPPDVPVTTALIDINNDRGTPAAPDANGNYWNQITNDTGAALALFDDENTATAWTVALTELNPATSSGFTGNLIETGPAPNDFNISDVFRDGWYDNAPNASRGEFTFSGLDTALDYTLTLYGNRDSGWANGIVNVTNGTSQGGPTYTLTQNTLLDLAFTPNSNGDFSFTLDDSGGPGSNVVLNALRLTSAPSAVLVPESAVVHALIPTDAALGDSWTGGAEPFDDSQWLQGTTGVGYSAGQEVPADLVGYWPLDESVGAVADDASAPDGAAEEYDGELLGGATWFNDPTRGQVLSLDGINGHVAVPDHDLLDPGSGPFTAAAWVNINDVAARQDIVAKQAPASGVYAGWALRISQSPGTRRVSVLLNGDNSANRIDVDGTRILAEDAWHHVAFTYDGSGNAAGVSLYINGVSDSVSSARGQLSIPVATDVDLGIGLNRRNGELPLQGLVDDVSVWQQALTPAQIASLASGESPLAVDGLNHLVGLDLENEMHGQSSSALLRIPFEAPTEAPYDRLNLQMRYGDGFVAYIDGVEVARRNAPDVVDWDASATTDRELADVLTPESISILNQAAAVTPGSHVLAIQGLTQSPASDEFLVLPRLTGVHDPEMVPDAFLLQPTPGAPNGEPVLGFVGDTRFSVDRGFFEEAFEVEITTSTPGATIRFTTDGSLPTLTHGETYVEPIDVTSTTTLRAIALLDGYAPSNVDTQTYIFRADVVTQTRPDGFPTETESPDHQMDYDVDPRIAQSPLLQEDFLASLVGLPSLSVVMDHQDLFEPANGIYPNSTRDGAAWQRAASVEWIDPAGGEEFQVDAGINVSGRSSRTWTNTPKHNFRLEFTSDFGPTKLDFDLFPDAAVSEFDELVIRSPVQDSWTTVRFEYRENAQYSVDRWIREVYRQQGHLATSGRFAHLYLNGLYWGIYEVAERPNEEFAAIHLGGEPADYDALNAGVVKNGDAVAWNRMHLIADGGGQFGDIASPEAYAELQEYLDVEAFADYVILNVYGANIDWPGNNYWALRERSADGKFLFVPWDNEHPLWESQWNTAEFGDASALDYNVLTSSRFLNGNSGAGFLYSRLIANEEFVVLVADRLQRHFANDGALASDVAANTFQQQLDHVRPGMLAESARWGDAWSDSPIAGNLPFSPDVDWSDSSTWLFESFFPARTAVVLEQFRVAGVFPTVEAPTFNQHGGLVPVGFELAVNAPAGDIYYTLDGSDPREQGGAVAAGALLWNGSPVALFDPTQVRTRAVVNGQWSALNEAAFYTAAAAVAANTTVTEVQYNPHPPTELEMATLPGIDSEALEFVEIWNHSDEAIDLSGTAFVDGIDYIFPFGTVLPAQQRIVIARDPVALAVRSPHIENLLGPFEGQLRNSGEQVLLLDRQGVPIAEFAYGDGGEWPGRADGRGSSLEFVDGQQNYSSSQNWHASLDYGGSPGVPGSATRDIVINETLSHTDPPLVDAIELFNTTDADVDVSGWWLSDSWNDYFKYQIPIGTSLPANGYLTFDESDFNASLGADPRDFALDGAHGDDVWLLASDPSGLPVRFADNVSFGAQANGESWGRMPDGSTQFVPLETPTLGSVNDVARIGPLVISELMYNAPNDPDQTLEFVEIYNSSDTSVSLTNWQLGAGVRYSFDAQELGPNEFAVVVGFDPNDAMLRSEFEMIYPTAVGALLLGPFDGNLDNGGEAVALYRPDTPPLEEPDFTPLLLEDQIVYDDAAPWADADGSGFSLVRGVNLGLGTDARSWAAAAPTPGGRDVSAPRVEDVLLNVDQMDPIDLPSGAAPVNWLLQRSLIRSFTIVFDEPVQAVANAFQLTNLGVNAPVDEDDVYDVSANFQVVDERTVRLVFTDGELMDGVYQLQVGTEIANAHGISMTESYLLTGSLENRVFQLKADWNGDGGTTIFDFSPFAYWFGTSIPAAPSYMDLNADGGVSIFDFSTFAAAFGGGITFPAAAKTNPSELPEILTRGTPDRRDEILASRFVDRVWADFIGLDAIADRATFDRGRFDG